MNSKSSDGEDSDGNYYCDSEVHNNSILRLSHYKKEIMINIIHDYQEIGYIKGVLLNVDNILKELKSDEVLKVLEFTDKEEEEEIKTFYIQVLSKKNCKDNAFYITELFIDKEYRGNGIGRKIFKQLPRFLDRNIKESISCIYLMPGPLEKINGEVEYIMNLKDEKMVFLKQRLIKFYESIGFRKIGGTDFYYKRKAS